MTKSLNNEKAQEAKLKSEVATEAEDQSNQSKAKNDSDTANNKTDDKSNAKVVEEGKGGNNTDAGDGAQSKADDGKSPDKKPNGNAEGEDSEEWSGLIDFEMSDIVILDEYDSNMNVEVGGVVLVSVSLFACILMLKMLYKTGKCCYGTKGIRRKGEESNSTSLYPSFSTTHHRASE